MRLTIRMSRLYLLAPGRTCLLLTTTVILNLLISVTFVNRISSQVKKQSELLPLSASNKIRNLQEQSQLKEEDNQNVDESSMLQLHLKTSTEQDHQHRLKQVQPLMAEEKMYVRKHFVQTFCDEYLPGTNDTVPKTTKQNLRHCMFISTYPPSKFCPIAKIGSTFWTRFYKILERDKPDSLNSPYDIPVREADETRCPVANKSISWGIGLPNGRMVAAMFVRDPYSRIFSAYVDKLLAPNPTFWTKWGKPALKLDGVAAKDIQCGQNVTFRQYFRLVISQLYAEDNHVFPMASICKPCETDYDVIGKMETFAEDLQTFMSMLNVTFKRDFELSRETKIDAITDSIESPFSWKSKIKSCISANEMGRRIWRKLQIRGVLRSDVSYPFENLDISNKSADEFIGVAIKVWAKSINKSTLSKQTKQAMIEAYRTIDISDLEKFVEVYQSDFQMFGYDAYPKIIFDRNTTFTDTMSFDFESPWQI